MGLNEHWVTFNSFFPFNLRQVVLTEVDELNKVFDVVTHAERFV